MAIKASSFMNTVVLHSNHLWCMWTRLKCSSLPTFLWTEWLYNQRRRLRAQWRYGRGQTMGLLSLTSIYLKNVSAYNLFTEISLQSHSWAPPHFHCPQFSPEESVIKLRKQSMYIWCWIHILPWWIYNGSFFMRFLLITIFLVSDVWHFVGMWTYYRLGFQLKHNSNNYNVCYAETTEHPKYFTFWSLTWDAKEMWCEFDSTVLSEHTNIVTATPESVVLFHELFLTGICTITGNGCY